VSQTHYEIEQAIVKRARAAIDALVEIMNEADAMGIEIGFSGIPRGKKNKFEVQGFVVKKDLTA